MRITRSPDTTAEVRDADDPYLAFFEAVIRALAGLTAQWMLWDSSTVCFNTDNTSIAGETIDYGPCAFMDAYHPDKVFSSIDQFGRYAFSNQPAVIKWNLARLAETLLPLTAGGEAGCRQGANASLRNSTSTIIRPISPGFAENLARRSRWKAIRTCQRFTGAHGRE